MIRLLLALVLVSLLGGCAWLDTDTKPYLTKHEFWDKKAAPPGGV